MCKSKWFVKSINDVNFAHNLCLLIIDLSYTVRSCQQKMVIFSWIIPKTWWTVKLWVCCLNWYVNV